MDKIVCFKNITKNFGQKIVLDNINLDIYRGEKIAVLGENGAGKTTFCEILSKIILPSKGTIEYFFNKNIFSDKAAIGIQLQARDWPGLLTGKQIVSFYQSVYKNLITDENIVLFLEIFDFTKYYNLSLQKLSPGQRQRFNLLLAFLHQPELIILDEPTNDLDANLQENFFNYLENILKPSNQTLLIVSHNILEIVKICHRVLFFADGKINSFVIKNDQNSIKQLSILFKKNKF